MRTHWRYLRTWLRAFVGWLAEPRYFWLGVSALAAALLVVWRVGASETCLRLTGLGLQLLGIATVWLGIRQTRMLFGRPDALALVGQWLRRFPFCGTRPVSATLAVSIPSAEAMGRGCARPTASDTSVDARLDALQKDVDLALRRLRISWTRVCV